MPQPGGSMDAASNDLRSSPPFQYRKLHTKEASPPLPSKHLLTPPLTPTYPVPESKADAQNESSAATGEAEALETIELLNSPKPKIEAELLGNHPWQEKNLSPHIIKEKKSLDIVKEKKSLGSIPGATLLQQPSKPTKEMEVIQDAMTDGFLKYGLPLSAFAMAGTFIMRRRYRTFKASPFESFILSALHYYGAISLGLYTGLCLYGPEFESKILEQIPESNVAKAMRENRKNRA